jgi:nicotinate dehydrogenase subunit A
MEGWKTAVSFELNGKKVSSSAEVTSPLLYVLRDEFDIQGARFGCGLGECGACTVLVGDTAVRSCQLPLADAKGQKITTLEGLGDAEHPNFMQKAFIEESAAQCGYCTNGMIMQSISFLNTNHHPTEAEVKSALNENMCRCGTHVRIIRAVLKAAATGEA